MAYFKAAVFKELRMEAEQLLDVPRAEAREAYAPGQTHESETKNQAEAENLLDVEPETVGSEPPQSNVKANENTGW